MAKRKRRTSTQNINSVGTLATVVQRLCRFPWSLQDKELQQEVATVYSLVIRMAKSRDIAVAEHILAGLVGPFPDTHWEALLALATETERVGFRLDRRRAIENILKRIEKAKGTTPELAIIDWNAVFPKLVKEPTPQEESDED